MCKWLLNGDNDGVAMTLTTAHHFAGNMRHEMLKIMPNTDADWCCPTLTQLCRGGWTLGNIFFFTPIKPGVLEVYAL